MSISTHIRSFISKKLEENSLTRQDFIKGSGIPSSTVSKLFDSKSTKNPTLRNLFKIVSYFNCSLDEVIGRENQNPNGEKEFQDIPFESIGNNLKKFINKKLKETGLDVYKLASKCGFSEQAIYEFMKEDHSRNLIGSAVVLGIASYFNSSIDEMVGRTGATDEKLYQTVKGYKQNEESKNAPNKLKNFSKRDLEAINHIKVSNKQVTLNTTDKGISDSTISRPHSKKKNQPDKGRG